MKVALHASLLRAKTGVSFVDVNPSIIRANRALTPCDQASVLAERPPKGNDQSAQGGIPKGKKKTLIIWA